MASKWIKFLFLFSKMMFRISELDKIMIRINIVYPGQYSQTICPLQIRWYRLWVGNILMFSVHCWKAGPGEVMTMENLFIYSELM